MIDDQRILDVFYTQLVPEAKTGKVNCYFIINMAFDLIIDNKEITKCNNLPYNGILIPTLKVTNKELFDEKLVEYVNKAFEIYNPSDFAFLDDLNATEIENLTDIKEEYLIKYIITMLFANASYSDFNYPIEFLNSRISMFENKILNHEGEIELGYLESIGARIYIEEEVSPIRAETPYRIKSYLRFDDGHQLLLPEIYAGCSDEKHHLYGIQKTTKNSETDEHAYLKQIRKGFIAKINGAPEHYFLTVMLFLSLCNDKEIEVVPFLVERWNAKRIAIYNKRKNSGTFSLMEKEKEQESIQTNITDIFIRYFKKLEDVSTGMDFYLVPFELDNNLHIKLAKDFESRSQVFNELFNLANNYKEERNNIRR